jgi:hypothetical protein
MLVGPNWLEIAGQERDAIPVLSAIRDEIGGTLVEAASPTPSPTSPSGQGPPEPSTGTGRKRSFGEHHRVPWHERRRPQR